ncbi:hypothetical protein QBC40DRAFT_329108 [Triangularia verruculosa]|uniref:Uncharacterized protein n=1 Tax=Triangularia verruculosa TaxID=2587418 RepID=A0AAN6XW10_9PEZI|nr:hypothetical protein QBC40DRAFT_329108 [Triangularia verruculosa]
MVVFCCCTSARSSKTRSTAPRSPETVLPSLPPPARLPGPLTLNPVNPLSTETSPRSLSSLQPSVPANISPIEPIELGQLVVEDSDSEDEPDHPAPHNKSTSTLQLVRTRIRRHLSQDSLSKKKARSAVGFTKEEIQRRAELKRLMHKRIQEELRSEEGQESTRSEVSSDRHPGSPKIDLLPGGGPRDNIEFVVTEDSRPNSPGMNRPEPDTDQTCNDETQDHPSAYPEALAPVAANFKTVRERSSFPEMPASPDLVPRRYPSTGETSSIGSWRLSYSAGQLDELFNYIDRGETSARADALRCSSVSPPESVVHISVSSGLHPPRHTHSLSRSHSSPARPGTQGNETTSIVEQSPLSVWLRSQGLRSRSSSLARSSDQEFEQGASVQQAEVVYLRRWSSVQNSAVPEAEIQKPEIVHLYDMDIHRQLGTRSHNTPMDSPTRSRSVRNSGASGSVGVHTSGSTIPPSSDPPSDKSACNQSEVILAAQDPNNLGTKSSSVYPSTGQSLQPSAGASTLDLPGTLAPHHVVPAFTLPGFKWLDTVNNPHLVGGSVESLHQAAGENSVNNGSAVLERHPADHRSSSATTADASSRFRKESQLDTVEKSIGYFNLGHGAPALIVKRFRKEADTPPPEPVKHSFLARLHLTLPRRAKLAPRNFDGATIEQEQQDQGSDAEPEPASPPVRQASGSKRGRPDSWGTAITSPYHPLTPILSEYEGSADDLWRATLQGGSQTKPTETHSNKGHRRGSSFPESLNRSLQAVADSEHSGGSSGYIGVPSTEPSCRFSSAPGSPVSHTTDCGLSSIAETTETPKHSSSTDNRSPIYAAFRTHYPTKSMDLTRDHPKSLVPRTSSRLRDSSTPGERSTCVTPEMTMDRPPLLVDDITRQPHKSDSRLTLKSSTQSISGKFGKVIKSSFGKLVSHRGFSNGTSSKSLESLKRRGSGAKTEILKLRKSQDVGASHRQGPDYWQLATPDRGHKISLSTRMATLLHADSSSEDEKQPRLSRHHHTLRHRAPLTNLPQNTPVRDHQASDTTENSKGSSKSTERFITPFSSFDHSNNDTASFHSCHATDNKGSTTDINSIKSDGSLACRLHVASAPHLNALPVGEAKFQTWSGRERSRPLITAQSMEQIRLRRVNTMVRVV